MLKVGVRIIHGDIAILSEFSKSQCAYYTWGISYTETYGTKSWILHVVSLLNDIV